MVLDEDSDSTSECGSVGSTPQVSLDNSDGREKSKLNGNEVSLSWRAMPSLILRKACERVWA